jgi:dTDP-4-amino-4,6-dideoxygalactose transaminase
MDPFKWIDLFEEELAEFTGAPYCVATDCCTHAIELAMRYDKVSHCEFSAHTYLSVLMIFHRLNISYTLTDEKWQNFYQFKNTRIWDCARTLSKNMYVPGTIQCLSFGRGKPLSIGRGGALLLDDKKAYDKIRLQRYDGRDLGILPWQNQINFPVGWHYKLLPDEAVIGRNKLSKLEFNTDQPGWEFYPDTRKIIIGDKDD